jgi:hypothetical protein
MNGATGEVPGFVLILNLMKNYLLLILFFCLSVYGKAQKVYFIYFQSDNASQFYIKMSEKVYSSTSAGYVLITDLPDSTYSFSIGFTSEQVPEAKFQVELQGQDKGFSVKAMADGVNLFDQQAMRFVKRTEDASRPVVGYENRNDAFTSMLSKASNDPALVMVPIYARVEEKPKPEAIEPAVATVASGTTADQLQVDSPKASFAENRNLISIDSSKTNQAAVQPPPIEEKDLVQEQQAAVKETVEATEVFTKSVIKRQSESSTSEGMGVVFVDADKEQADTVRIWIPNPKVAFQVQDTTTRQEPQFLDIQKTDSTKAATVEVVEPKKVESAPVTDSLSGLKVDVPVNVPAEDTIMIRVSAKPKTGLTPNRPKCAAMASDNDFFKLRKNMAARESDEDMIAEARKALKGRCFSSEQIKLLSSLFLTAAGKYQFFDAAFLRVSDFENFASLESELKEEYYIKRFKALLGE